MGDIIENLKKDPNIHNEISHTIDKYNTKSFPTRFQVSQNALIQCKVFKQAIKILGETISDMQIELEQKDNKIQLLVYFIELSKQLYKYTMIRVDSTAFLTLTMY